MSYGFFGLLDIHFESCGTFSTIPVLSRDGHTHFQSRPQPLTEPVLASPEIASSVLSVARHHRLELALQSI